MCRKPVGLGAKRVRTGCISEVYTRPWAEGVACAPAPILLSDSLATARNGSTFELAAGSEAVLKILIDRLEDSPRRYAFDAEPAWWEAARALLPELEGADREAFQFDVTAYRMGQDVYLEGQVRGVFGLECSRCLTWYASPLRESFRLVLEPAGDRVPAEPEAAAALARDGMCRSDDIETGWFRGRELDLGPFLLEVVTLTLPVQPLCREDCRGLCPCCGTDRNQTACRCEEAKPASPFAALRVLRRDASEGES